MSLGTIEPDTEVTVVFTDVITKRRQAVTATSDGYGLLVVDVTEILSFFSPNFIYTIAIFSDVSNACPDVELTIDEIVVPCVQVEFFACNGIEGEESVLKLQDPTDDLEDENGDPLLDENFNPLEA